MADRYEERARELIARLYGYDQLVLNSRSSAEGDVPLLADALREAAREALHGFVGSLDEAAGGCPHGAVFDAGHPLAGASRFNAYVWASAAAEDYAAESGLLANDGSGSSAVDGWPELRDEAQKAYCRAAANWLEHAANRSVAAEPKGVPAFYGTWPGDETDAELLEGLRELGGRGDEPAPAPDPEWDVWQPEHDEERGDGHRIRARSAMDAATQWAQGDMDEWPEPEGYDYETITRNTPARICVAQAGSEEVERFRVFGEWAWEPVYTVVEEPELCQCGCPRGECQCVATMKALDVQAPERCRRCNGEGRIASSEGGEPWSLWEDLPPGSDAAVRMGLVRPVPCPDCGGTGEGGGHE